MPDPGEETDMSAVRHVAPTLEMVAARAGVSRATVSRVVNGSDKVNPASVESVRAAISELGYVPNRAARSLASAQSHAIALVVPEDITRFFGDVFFASIVAGINDRLEQSDYVLNLMVASSDPGAKNSRYLMGGAVDGAVVVSHHTSDHFLERIGDAIPLVFGGRPGLDKIDTWVVDVDNEEGGAVAASRLVERGCRHVATISGPTDMQSANERTRGWRRVVAAAGLEPGPAISGDFTALGGAQAMRELLARYPEVDGVFVASDLMASAALPVLLDSGRRIPEDVAVVGYDDSPHAVQGPVQLTTVKQPSEAMGREMADILLDVLAGNERPWSTILPIELVERDSA
ncbi:LacI family DNA-binding transcriptional regulator [Demequina salsinemoris]|uniref:LacI family DNA-binding transcriptional regulator n=1 Tax=Demequina salsinemoris TaxID=577470 RepID=UPI000A7ACCB5|nr:LacI family DNA-binding transcriptional regulator [Demequina salsinemoris]